MRKTAQREIELSVLLYRKGLAVEDIAALVEKSTYTVKNYLRIFGEIEKGHKMKKSKVKVTPEIRRFVDNYTERGMEPPSQDRPRRPPFTRRTPEEVVTPACHPRIYEMAKAGFTVGDIAAALGISMSECSRRVRQHIAYVKMKDIAKKG